MPSSTEVFTELVLEVFRFNGRLLAAGDRLSAPVGLTSARWQVLGAIDERPLTAAQIGRAMGVTRQSVQRTVDMLRSENIVELRANPDHKRAHLIALTTRGRAMLDEISGLQKDWARRSSDGITADRMQAALDVVRALRRQLERMEEAGDANAP